MDKIDQLFEDLNPSQISRSKASETLIYIRYLLKRETDNEEILKLEGYRAILKARLAELNSLAGLPNISNFDPTLTLNKNLSSGNTDQTLE